MNLESQQDAVVKPLIAECIKREKKFSAARDFILKL